MISFVSELIFRLIYPILYILHKRSGYSTDAIKRKCGDFETPNWGDSKVIMFHGVSVGEINAIEKLVKKSKEIYSDCKVIITTGTNAGQENALKKLGDIADFITYFPFDTPSCVKNFLDKINPDIILIAETEIWPNISIECKKRGIKLCIINGRISDRTYNSYKKLKFFFKPLLNNYTGIYTQSTEDLNKFLALGANPNTTERMNNLKFDITTPIVDIDFDKQGRILLAASTHSGEDKIIIDAFKRLKEKFSDLKLIIAPRHITRVNEIETILHNENLPYILRKDSNDNLTTNMNNNNIMILNTLGELGKFFAFADISFIGGSFNKTGGHNPLESIIFNKPAVSGPSIHNFKDIYAIIRNAGAGFVVSNKEELLNMLEKLLSDTVFYNKTSLSAENVFRTQQGALNFVINNVLNFLHK